MDMLCPNCGHELVPYRTVQQKAHTRDVHLEWSICSRCRHVALNDWSFQEPLKAAAGTERKVQRKKRKEPTQNLFSPWTPRAQRA